jgi:hypothetical protein
MSTSQYTLKSGDIIRLVYQGAKSVVVAIETSDGTRVQSKLHPGAQCELTAGAGPVIVSIHDGGDDSGLRVFRDSGG